MYGRVCVTRVWEMGWVRCDAVPAIECFIYFARDGAAVGGEVLQVALVLLRCAGAVQEAKYSPVIDGSLVVWTVNIPARLLLLFVMMFLATSVLHQPARGACT